MAGNVKAQKSLIQKFKKMRYPEKIWVLTHPFVAKKAWDITKHAQQKAKEMVDDPAFDRDANGGQVDAFRHTYWMALLSQKIGARKALSLGKAHEKSNRVDYKRHELEDGSLPDSVSCEMDLRNNKIGIELGKLHKTATDTTLCAIVKQTVLDGKCWKIRKNEHGRFLDYNIKVIEDEAWKGKWINPKTLVPSNYLRK